jgi:hypothetical protein
MLGLIGASVSYTRGENRAFAVSAAGLGAVALAWQAMMTSLGALILIVIIFAVANAAWSKALHDSYHSGAAVRVGADVLTNLPLNAPTFAGDFWRAERDGSIRTNHGRVACEFVSPILRGGDGVEHLIQFVEWANAIGANVNGSCGCRITVGVESIIGTNDPQAMSEFARKLAHIARWHAMSLYGQTGAPDAT